MSTERFIRRPEVEAITGFSRPHIYSEMKAGNFPRPYRLSARAVGWKASEIEAWMSEREHATAA